MTGDYIGRGWAFPVGTDATGSIALVDGPAKVEQSIRIILGTSPGERPMRPEFGCGAHELVFSSSDARLFSRVEEEVRVALERWEPRIDLRRVQALVDDEQPTTLLVSTDYEIRHENNPRNLVFPFYAIGEEH